MAKEKEVLDGVLRKSTDKDFVDRIISDQSEDFPQTSDVEVSFKYSDPFEVPKWCDQVNYAFGWVDLRDDIDRHRALEVNHFRIVTRMSSCIKDRKKIVDRDFRDHGAVERQGVFLVFRPKDLDDKLRTYSVLQHGEMVSSLAAGKEEKGFELTHTKSKEDKGGSGIDVYAYEEAGEHAPTAADLKPGELRTT